MQIVKTIYTLGPAPRLFVRRYRGRSAGRGQSLVIVHGAGEYGDRYAHLAHLAASQGWDVIVPDLRGHGRSGGGPVHVNRFDAYQLDLMRLWMYFELQSRPTLLVGHSLGGLISLRSCQTNTIRPDALVMSSPLLRLKVKIPPWKLAAGHLCRKVYPRKRFKTVVRPDMLCRDPEQLSLRKADPLIHRSITAGWFFATKEACWRARRESTPKSMPVLLLQGEADEVVCPETAKRWVESQKSDLACYIGLEDHLHEIFHEPTWKETARHMLDWSQEVMFPPEPHGPAVGARVLPFESITADRAA